MSGKQFQYQHFKGKSRVVFFPMAFGHPYGTIAHNARHHLSLIQGFEVEMYSRAVQSDVQQNNSCCSLHIATNIL